MRLNRSQVELDKRHADKVNSTENRSPEKELKELSDRQYLVEYDKESPILASFGENNWWNISCQIYSTQRNLH
jgi:hypothetical protein